MHKTTLAPERISPPQPLENVETPGTGFSPVHFFMHAQWTGENACPTLRPADPLQNGMEI
jgi:hypothetical protein